MLSCASLIAKSMYSFELCAIGGSEIFICLYTALATLVLKYVSGIVIVGVPTVIASRMVFPPPKYNGSNSTFIQLHKEINSSKDKLFVNKTLSLRIEKLLAHLFFRVFDQYSIFTLYNDIIYDIIIFHSTFKTHIGYPFTLLNNII